ncbi:MAG: hypothetical protein ACAF41_02360 [Leptolyngbya sp. BL-A-14]
MMSQPYFFSSVWTVSTPPSNSHRQPTELSLAPECDVQAVVQPLSLVPELESSSKKRRKRGLVLSHRGWQKLLQARVVYNAFGDRHTLEELSEKTLLDPRTVCRLLDRGVGIDKRTLQTFFDAFSLPLEPEDYTTPDGMNARQHEPEKEETFSPPVQPSFSLKPQPHADEVAQLKQKIIENCRRLATFLDLDGTDQVMLTVKLARHESPQLEVTFRRSC